MAQRLHRIASGLLDPSETPKGKDQENETSISLQFVLWMVTHGGPRVCPGADHGDLELVSRAGNDFRGSTVRGTSGHLSGAEPASNGSAGDYLETGFAAGDGADAVDFQWPGNGVPLRGNQFFNDGLATDDAQGHVGCSAGGSLANRIVTRRPCHGGSDYAMATGPATGHTDAPASCLLATGQCGEPGSSTGGSKCEFEFVLCQ